MYNSGSNSGVTQAELMTSDPLALVFFITDLKKTRQIRKVKKCKNVFCMHVLDF